MYRYWIIVNNFHKLTLNLFSEQFKKIITSKTVIQRIFRMVRSEFDSKERLKIVKD